MSELIDRQETLDALDKRFESLLRRFDYDSYENADEKTKLVCDGLSEAEDVVMGMPSAHPPKEIPKRVLWSGWKGYRDTRYKCPNCEKPVRNDDAYCHRCGQRLMFPKISFTDYVPGEKQDVIVRWDDEG